MDDNADDRRALTRRSALRTVGAVSVAGVGLAGCMGDETEGAGSSSDSGRETDVNDSSDGTGTDDSGGANESASDEEPEVDFETGRNTYPIMEGSVYETPVYVLESAADGPTAVVLGGVHGNETGGVEAAHVATEYDVGRGTVVVIPETNRPAVEDETRAGPDGDLNRQFPVDKEPTTELAQAVWGVLRDHDPDCVIDMHTSKGVYEFHDVGVGQAVFPHGGQDAIEDAHAATDRINERYLGELLGDDLPTGYAFQPVYGEHDHEQIAENEEDRMIVPTAVQQFGLKGWVTEVTHQGFDLEAVTFLHDRLAIAMLDRNEIPIKSSFDDVDNPLLE